MRSHASVLVALLALAVLPVGSAVAEEMPTVVVRAEKAQEPMPTVTVQAHRPNEPTATVVITAHEDGGASRNVPMLVFSGLLVVGGLLLASVKRFRLFHSR
jgi:hypothetical protein